MSKTRNKRQKEALRHAITRRASDQPLVTPINGVDIAPYQSWALQTLGFEFTNPDLLVTALTHRSYINEHRKAGDHNERLEFLGDAILELVVTDYLFRNFEVPEGILTAWRSALVKTSSIRQAGIELGYAHLIRMSKGERNGLEQAKLHMVANCFEALLGATYLDQGFIAAKEIVDRYILVNVDQILRDQTWRDPKSYLQELSQHHFNVSPKYRLVSETGPDHDKMFVISALVNDSVYGTGQGTSKQQAEQNAAKQAIARLKSEGGNNDKQR